MKTFDETWFNIILTSGLAILSLAVLIQLVYAMQIMGTKSRTEKYRLASKNESKKLRSSAKIFSVGIIFLAFAMFSRAIGLVEFYTFFFVGFISVLIGLSIGYGLWAYLKYYYPFILEKRLHDIRFKPMKSPHHEGHMMKLLNEDEEDTHLSQKMLEEEESLTVDYDVWIDEDTGHKVIERYDTHFHALVCDNCKFRTLKEKKEEIIIEPTSFEEGQLLKHYTCSYCGYHTTKEVSLPSWSDENEFAKLEKDID